MKIIDSEDEANKAKQILEEDMSIDKTMDKGEFTSFEINWVDWIECYHEAKTRAIDLFGQDYDNRLFFLASSKDNIRGKPQLIHENYQRIPLVRKITSVKKAKGEDEQYVTEYKFIDDIFDKRYGGEIQATLAFDFLVYRVVDKGQEHYIFSEKRLPTEFCEFEGMKVQLDDISDISANLKVKKLSSVFICKHAEPAVKIIEPIKLIEFVKEKEMNVDTFHDMLFQHPDGNIYDYTPDFNLIRKAQLLSSRYEGYPLHLMKIGPVGTGKTTEAEVINYKFQEDDGILEAANSTLKVLVPSFKEKPANLGYIAKCNRVAIIDEMMKMVEAALGHDNTRVSNYFGQMNMLLEHKDRTVGSGNDNSTRVKATAKVLITSNNIVGKNKIASHLGVIDPTTLSRMLVWVQDYEEIEKIYNKEGIKSPPHRDNPPNNFSCERSYEEIDISDGDGVGGIYNDFLTIYDSCQKFIVNYDKVKCKKLFDTITNLTVEPMKQVWRARGLHHVILLLDGITKHRCLFKDYDNTYNPKDEDYDDLERILIHMVNTWDTDFRGKQNE